MKYVKQLLIILAVTFLGELAKYLLPFPVPAGIYGMVLLLIALLTGLIKPEAIRETGLFLVTVMPVMFIPAAVGLMDSFSELRSFLFPFLTVMIVVLVAVFFVTGRVAQRIIRKKNGQKEEER